MKFQRLAAVAAATVLAFSGVAVTAAPAQATASKPGVVVNYDHHKIKVKPKTIRPYKDVYYSSIHWTSLTKTTGHATAVQNVNTCKPSCADANYKRIKVKLKFTTIKLSDCRRVFSKIKVTEVKSRKTYTQRLPVFARTGC